ncbi:hypothetical protein MC885_019076, partial [Smutsia gigantea]
REEGSALHKGKATRPRLEELPGPRGSGRDLRDCAGQDGYGAGAWPSAGTTASRDGPKPIPARLAVVRPGLRPLPSRSQLPVALPVRVRAGGGSTEQEAEGSRSAALCQVAAAHSGENPRRRREQG